MVTIIRAIVHEIPEGRYQAGADRQVALSTAESSLAPETKRFIEENMLDFALKNPRNIIQDEGAVSGTPGVVLEILDDPSAHFISGSQTLAQNLYQAQTGNSPSGILIVATVVVPEGQALIIMKAEHQEGMRLQRIGDDTTGHFDLEHLDELIVGNNSRVYKIAMLREADGTVLGEMVDQQNGVAFADFFLAAFLGCRLADSAEIQTKHFMDSTMAYINKHVIDEEKRGRYATALVAYMSTPAETFQASEFADQFLEAEDRDVFAHSLPEHVSGAVIAKNLALVPGQGAGLRLYGSGVVISASAIALERGAIAVTEEDGQTIVRVAGALKRYGLGAAPKS
ncbi:nucleoid-associated protein [Homoserinimonas sp. A447]